MVKGVFPAACCSLKGCWEAYDPSLRVILSPREKSLHFHSFVIQVRLGVKEVTILKSALRLYDYSLSTFFLEVY
jgi:hypothetical protein